jgi:hypothetical protein
MPGVTRAAPHAVRGSPAAADPRGLPEPGAFSACPVSSVVALAARPMPSRSSGRRRLRKALVRGRERAEHLHHQAARPAQKHRVLDPQRVGARCRIPGRQNPPEFCSQRRGYRSFKLTVDRLELTLQPGHPLGRQRGPIRLLVSRLQQRPHAQQPIWLLGPFRSGLSGHVFPCELNRVGRPVR